MTEPHGAWIWVLEDIDPNHVRRLKEQQAKRVYLKVFDGRSSPMFWGFQCSPDIIKSFKDEGIDVYGWGYHYGTPDVDSQVSSVQQALACGLSGYIVDVEAEVEDPTTHIHVRRLLNDLRAGMNGKQLGYTSFGHPKFHPNVPWKDLDSLCDIALPQIYYEKFGFGSSNEDEVQACLSAHQDLGLTKPLLPIWGSESDSKNPSPASELQSYLNRFPGSSIWRLPRVGERGRAWELDYRGSNPLPIGGAIASAEALPVLTRVLRKGSLGEDVKSLQKRLTVLGFDLGDVDSNFGRRTEAAVIAFQSKAGLVVDGVVGKETWRALGTTTGSVAHTRIASSEQGIHEKLAEFAEEEASKRLTWTGPSSEAEKYLDIFRAPMLALGQIGRAKIFYDWCGAYVYYCCQRVSLPFPIQPEGYFATLALVEAWKHYAKQKGFWIPKGSSNPLRGDIVLFDWRRDGIMNHIGIVRRYEPGSSIIKTSEGNRRNFSGNFHRELRHVAGFIRTK